VLTLVPPAALAALVFPSLLLVDGGVSIGLDNQRLFAGIVAGGVAWRTGNLLATVVVGMGVFWVLTLVV
jgi:branched-subunit amino acid transport protein